MKQRPIEAEQAAIDALRRMTPSQRLEQAFALSEFTRTLFKEGLRRRFPRMNDEEIHKLFLERIALCHNRNS